jgi:hypothetical protein
MPQAAALTPRPRSFELVAARRIALERPSAKEGW